MTQDTIMHRDIERGQVRTQMLLGQYRNALQEVCGRGKPGVCGQAKAGVDDKKGMSKKERKKLKKKTKKIEKSQKKKHPAPQPCLTTLIGAEQLFNVL